MGQYEVVAPCAYLVDNKATIHRKLGVIIELDDELAAGLPGALRPIARAAAAEPASASNLDDPRHDENAVEVTSEPEAEAPKPKPRRTRTDDPGSDGQD
jgi:hypothetical protein